jgi:hypothetical protein
MITHLFIERMEAILQLYQQPHDTKRPMVNFDEKSVQLLDEVCASQTCQPRKPTREDYEYKRNGTRNLFLFVEPKAGFRQVMVTRHRKKVNFAYAVRYLVAVLYPNADMIDVVLDNLNTHHYYSL